MASRPRVPIPRHRRLRARISAATARALPAAARARQTTTAWAIVSLIAGVSAMVLPASAPATTGYRRRRQGGAGLSIALVGGSSRCGAAVAAIVFVVIVGKGTVTATDVKVGDCLKEIPGNTRVLTVDTVGCDKSHAGEVFAVLLMPEGRLSRGSPRSRSTRTSASPSWPPMHPTRSPTTRCSCTCCIRQPKHGSRAIGR